MNIILAEERADGQQLTEQSFSKDSIVFGRDAFGCDVAFDSTRHPMVSRRHAELRWSNGNWVLVDLNSSYGTFINGQRVSGAADVQVGSALQFGQDGPVLRVVWFETFSDAAQPAARQAERISQTPSPSLMPIAAPGSVPLPPRRSITATAATHHAQG
ncbi:MAG: FHA domain-containing protein [Blastocatellia bacterium]|nr:FHA domain-containing protein [Blastocatellia bacterium]